MFIRQSCEIIQIFQIFKDKKRKCLLVPFNQFTDFLSYNSGKTNFQSIIIYPNYIDKIGHWLLRMNFEHVKIEKKSNIISNNFIKQLKIQKRFKAFSDLYNKDLKQMGCQSELQKYLYIYIYIYIYKIIFVHINIYIYIYIYI